MPNRVQRGLEIAAAKPGRRMGPLVARHREGVTMDLGGGKYRLLRSTGPWHRDTPGPVTEADEIDTDLVTDSGVGGFTHRGKNLDVDVRVNGQGARRIVYAPGEFLIFGRPERWDGSHWGPLVAPGPPEFIENRLHLNGPDWSALIGVLPSGLAFEYTAEDASTLTDLRFRVTAVNMTWDGTDTFVGSDGGGLTISPAFWADAALDRGEVAWSFDGTHYILHAPTIPFPVFPVTIDPSITNKGIAAGADDGYRQTADFQSGTTTTGFGYSKNVNHTWLRFTNITVDQGDTIDASDVDFIVGAATGNNVEGVVTCVDEDDHVAPTTGGEWDTDHGIHTTASVQWDFTSGSSNGDAHTSAELKTIVQEIVDRGSWASGNDIGFHFDDDIGSGKSKITNWATYENTSYTEPQLDIDYSVPIQNLVGASSSTSSTTGVLDVTKNLVGATAAASSTTGVIEKTVEAVGASAGVSAASGDLIHITTHELAGLTAGVSTVTGVLEKTVELVGAAASASTGAGVLEKTVNLVGASTGASTASGALEKTVELVGATTAASTASGALDKTVELVGVSAGASSVSGTLESVVELTGAASPASTVAGTLEKTVELVGLSAGVSAASGNIQTPKSLTGAAAPASAASGVLEVTKEIAGTVTGASTASGAVEVTVNLVGSTTAASAASGALQGVTELTGATAAVSAASGTLEVTKELVGLTAAASTIAGALRVIKELPGAVTPASSASGAIEITKSLVGLTQAVSAASGDLTRLVELIGLSTAASSATGHLWKRQVTGVRGVGAVTATLAGVGAATSTLTLVHGSVSDELTKIGSVDG